MLTPDATYHPAPFRDDPVAAAEEDIRRYLFAHRVVPVARARSARGNPLIVLLGIYAILAVIMALGSLWLKQVECDPMIMDRGLSGACRDWSRDLNKIVGANAAPRLAEPDSL